MKHMSMNIAGALRNWNDKRCSPKDAFTRDDGTPMPSQEARLELERHLAAGEKLMAMGQCDNFDPQTGCKGHS